VEEAMQMRPHWELVGYSDTLSPCRVMAPNSLADVFLVDLGLPDGRGEDMLRMLAVQARSRVAGVHRLWRRIAAHSNALQMGATGYVLKGCSTEELVQAIEQVRRAVRPFPPCWRACC
jgi:DNA-binding NarL/FixJ family response regulator